MVYQWNKGLADGFIAVFDIDEVGGDGVGSAFAGEYHFVIAA